MKRFFLLLAALQLVTVGFAQISSFDTGWRFSLGHAADPVRDFGAGTEYFNYLTKAASIHNAGPYAPDFDDHLWQEVQLPHDWVVDLPFAPQASHSHGYKTVGWAYPESSVGWYRKHFFVPAEADGEAISLRFDGIFRDSRIWVNGFYLGGEADGYTSRTYRISEYLHYGGDNVVTVRADASFEQGWWYEGAGIYRHVWLIRGEEAAPAPVPERSIVFDPEQGLLVDGVRQTLRGVNLHQDHAGVGVAIPDALHLYRLLRLKELGVNAIRMAHNPASPVLLDLCDSLGIWVIEETRLMGVNEAELEPLRRMIERDRHHPSILAWGIGNEEWGIEWDPRGERIAAAMTAYCHALDPTRPVYVASSSGPEVLKGVDVAGYNYILQNPIDQHHFTFPARPAMGTEETSGCGTRGQYTDDPTRGRMAALNRRPQGPDSLYNAIERGWKFYDERPWLAGLFYWTGFDYRGEPNPLEFPATGSQFGILDYCGFPKDEAFYLRSWFQDEPVLHILPHWNLAGHEGEEVSVWVYSNCEEVSLTVNGRRLGRQKMPRGGHLEWKTRYRPGTLKAEAYNGGRRVLVETVHTAGEPTRFSEEVFTLSGGRRLAADGNDVAVVDLRLQDSRGNFAPTACLPIRISVEGPVRILGAGNGDPAFQGRERPEDPLARSFEIESFHGCAQLLLQSLPVRGEATLRLSAEGMETRVISFQIQ